MANLNEFTNEQRESHRVAVCTALGLDPSPALGNLDYAWMPQENRTKNLVLYAKRGVTEQLREINGVSITSLEQHDGPGYVSFKATAVNKKGRQEIANGTHETEGLKGKKLADAVMTAQTRSLRRVTLQFAGYGILDESELHTEPTNIASSEASLAQLSGTAAVMPPPTVIPNTNPGKDITPVVGMEANIKKVYEDGAKGLADIKVDTFDAGGPPNIKEPTSSVSVQTDIKADIPAEEPRKKRTYRRRNQVNIASPNQQTEMPAGHIDAAGNITPVQVSVPPATANDPERGASGNGARSIPALAEKLPNADLPQSQQPTTPFPMRTEIASVGISQQPIKVDNLPPQPIKVDAPVIDKAKQDEYKARLRKYSNDILPSGGMTPSEGVGGTTMKLRKFAQMQLGVEVASLTEDQFEELFGFLDSYLAKNGAQALVQYIDKALGVIK